ncbi:MAG: hypothetical protein L0Y71_23895 [Gemmataceae bacterium]|nr:hypothetical protein [Gemmataceae bacterium]
MVDLETIFPGLAGSSHQVTSLATDLYNCIAWAAGDVSRWWWPDLFRQRYWPANARREETLIAFQEAFGSVGFGVCVNENLETGFEKIALFADDHGPQHAARQLPNGRWTSKLGEREDIEHDLHALEGVEYGKVVMLMSRPVSAP